MTPARRFIQLFGLACIQRRTGIQMVAKRTRICQRWIIAIKKIQISNTLSIISILSNWIKKANFQLLITNYLFKNGHLQFWSDLSDLILCKHNSCKNTLFN